MMMMIIINTYICTCTLLEYLFNLPLLFDSLDNITSEINDFLIHCHRLTVSSTYN